jgi:predicted phosphodiesterase
MKLAVLSDVHANLEALRSVFAFVKEARPDRVFFLGDAVGYGPDPNECLDLLRQFCTVSLQGNHDAAACDLMGTENFNVFAKAAVDYTRQILSKDHRIFLSGLPSLEQRRTLCLAHSSPFQPERWHYLFTEGDGAFNFNHFQGAVCFVGHSHQPAVFTQDPEGKVTLRPFDEVELAQGSRYIINVGSVGQPRDSDPRAAVAFYDDATRRLRLVRLRYNITAVQEKMAKAGLPLYLINRLARGV